MCLPVSRILLTTVSTWASSPTCQWDYLVAVRKTAPPHLWGRSRCNHLQSDDVTSSFICTLTLEGKSHRGEACVYFHVSATLFWVNVIPCLLRCHKQASSAKIKRLSVNTFQPKETSLIKIIARLIDYFLFSVQTHTLPLCTLFFIFVLVDFKQFMKQPKN